MWQTEGPLLTCFGARAPNASLLHVGVNINSLFCYVIGQCAHALLKIQTFLRSCFGNFKTYRQSKKWKLKSFIVPSHF